MNFRYKLLMAAALTTFFLGCSNTTSKQTEIARPDIVVDSSGVSNYWVITKDATPQYPRKVAFGKQGRCVNMEYVIGSDGNTYNHRVVKIFPESERQIENAVIKALKRRRYEPAAENVDRIPVVTNNISTFYVVKSPAPEGLSEKINEALKLECKQ